LLTAVSWLAGMAAWPASTCAGASATIGASTAVVVGREAPFEDRAPERRA
jgi:hypothetical protein